MSDGEEHAAASSDMPVEPRMSPVVKRWPPKQITQHFEERDGKVYLLREEIVYGN
jgi:hypothetical protein